MAFCYEKMGGASSVSEGNLTESSVTNSTTNEQYFNMDTCVSIVNTLEQMNTLIANAQTVVDQGTFVSAMNKIKNTVINISGSGNTITLSANANAVQQAKAFGTLSGYLNHSADFCDAVMFDIANYGSSEQLAEMISTATSTKTMELDVSGIGAVAAQSSINNSVISNVNNSIRNLFSMNVNVCMSSKTQRNLCSANVTAAYTAAKQISENIAVTELEGVTINIKGDNNVIEAASAADSTAGAILESTVTTNLISSLQASTGNIASASSTAEGKTESHSTATATSEDSQKTSLDTNIFGGAIIAVALVVAVILLG